ncbi:MAG: ACT domain-containing protein [Parasporobacterium sp.]|nr:ACT domain-containing protein [Parasporobacterium sp.]
MAVKQLSVFLENKPGTLANLASILADAKINLKAMTVADTKDFGIARMIVDDTDKALVALSSAGQTAKVREVCGFKVPDEVGGLAKVLGILAENGLSVEYMYAIITSDSDTAHIVARVDDNEAADKVLLDNGIELLEF